MAEHIYSLTEFKEILLKNYNSPNHPFLNRSKDDSDYRVWFCYQHYANRGEENFIKQLYVVLGHYEYDIFVDDDVYEYVKDFLEPEKDFTQTHCDNNGCEERYTKGREDCFEAFDYRLLFKRDRERLIDIALEDL